MRAPPSLRSLVGQLPVAAAPILLRSEALTPALLLWYNVDAWRGYGPKKDHIADQLAYHNGWSHSLQIDDFIWLPDK